MIPNGFDPGFVRSLDPEFLLFLPEEHEGLCLLCGRASPLDVCEHCEVALSSSHLYHAEFSNG